jgi:hypothetical protein
MTNIRKQYIVASNNKAIHLGGGEIICSVSTYCKYSSKIELKKQAVNLTLQS